MNPLNRKNFYLEAAFRAPSLTHGELVPWTWLGNCQARAQAQPEESVGLAPTGSRSCRTERGLSSCLQPGPCQPPAARTEATASNSGGRRGLPSAQAVLRAHGTAGLLSDRRRRTPALQNSKTAATKDIRKGSQEISAKRPGSKACGISTRRSVHLSSGVTCRNHPSHLSLSSKAQIGASIRDPALTEGGPSGASVNESPAPINGLKTSKDIRRVRQPRQQLPLSRTPRRDTG